MLNHRRIEDMRDPSTPSGTNAPLRPEPDGAALAQRVVKLCADCEVCRDLMDDSPCLFFPRLYQLHDRAAADGVAIAQVDLKELVGLCNMCGLCACPDVRAGIMEAKAAFVARDGMPRALRLLEDVERIGRVGTAVPLLANSLLARGRKGGLLRRLLGIHPDRRLPSFPEESFATWARRRGLDRKPRGSSRRVAYFAGCTALYLFPAVARATVEVLERNGVYVHVPEQRCCGMPAMLEGDRELTLAAAEFNLRRLADLVDDGFDVVCSCPTCGFMLKKVLCDGAFYSDEYRDSFRSALTDGAAAGKSLEQIGGECLRLGPNATPPSARCAPPAGLAHLLSTPLRDDGYFRSSSALRRLAVASHTYDLGEYLAARDGRRELDRTLRPIPERLAYYAPCHQKEQNIGRPWMTLLGLVPSASVEDVGGRFDCCGMGGIQGLKREFHDTSLRMGARLAERIAAAEPARIVTDCLSCRIQFEQMLPYPVRHPVEILREAYASRP